jgi:putative tryptophan/tyrosine transport system substrate-binding protein
MHRREFITLLGGAAAWPVAARAQQDMSSRRIGVLMSLAGDDTRGRAFVAAFTDALRQLGWADGRNARIETRWTGGDPERVRRSAAELVAIVPDVILCVGAVTVGPVLRVTHAVPIVFVVVPDPVGAGFVESLAHPGGNATGFLMFEYAIGAKWLELLKELAPHVSRAAVVRDPDNTAGTGQWGAIQSAAPSFGVELSPVNVRDAGEIERAIAAFARRPNSGLLVTANARLR